MGGVVFKISRSEKFDTPEPFPYLVAKYRACPEALRYVCMSKETCPFEQVPGCV